MHLKLLALIVVMVMPFAGGARVYAAEGEVVVRDAWIREAPPNARVLAGYLTLENPSSEPLRLEGAEAGQFGSVEMHRTIHEDGMAKMVPQPYIDIPPEGQVELAPGGYHLMLMMPAARFVEGDVVPLELIFQGDERVSVPFEVRKSDAAGEAHHHHHH